MSNTTPVIERSNVNTIPTLQKRGNSVDECNICFDDDVQCVKCDSCNQYTCAGCRKFDGISKYTCVSCQHAIRYS